MIIVAAAAAAAALALAAPGGAYPGEGSGGGAYQGWTGESAIAWADPHHAQAAAAGGWLYVVADDGSDVRFARSSDGGATFSGMRVLDHDQAGPARDAYIVAAGSDVAASWKEFSGGKWGLVAAFSNDGGATWKHYRDANPACDNYEAHLAMAGGKVHGAYVSNASGQNEVYYRRWSTGGALEVDYRRASDEGGCADTQPCIEATDNTNISIYYRHEDAPEASIYQSYTVDGGASWNRVLRICCPRVESSWPECVRYGGRVTLVCQGRFKAQDCYAMQYTSYNGSEWGAPNAYTAETGTTAPYYQVAAAGRKVLVTYRDSSGSTAPAQRVSGFYNAGGGSGGQWQHVNQLFYGNTSYDNPGSTGVCSDGSRFYAVSAGTGPCNRVLVKREDQAPPLLSLISPAASPSYHQGDVAVKAEARDDWDFSAASLLSPSPEAYQRGVLHVDFFYRLQGTAAWAPFPGGSRVHDAPWEKALSVGTAEAPVLADGFYELRAVAVDTAEHLTEVVCRDVCIDRAAPCAAGAVSGGLREPDSEWFRAAPNVSGEFADALSGVEDSSRQYREDGGEWTDYPEGGFAASEGAHTYYFRCCDRAGNAFEDAAGTRVKVDSVPPVPSSSLPEADGMNGWRRSDASATVTLAAADNDGGSGVAEIRYVWDGTPEITYGAPVVCPEGVHSIYFMARDVAGNWSEIARREVSKDTTPPTVAILEPTGEKWIRGMVTVKADPADNCLTGTVDFYMDGELFDHREGSPWVASLDTTAWNNDYHRLSVTASDAAGNSSAAGGRAQVEVFVGNNISETNNFAEGCTRDGFDTWLCLQNPGDEAAGVTVNYMLGPGQGAAGARNYAVPAHSRMTVLVNNDIGPDRDVSIQVTSSRPIVSERPMYFDYAGTADLGWKGSHTAQGVSVPLEEWYLAEGCTRDGFEEWICIQNPGDAPAEVTIEYMLGDGRVITRSHRVNNWQRHTILVNEEVGGGQDVSARVRSTRPIVVERPMYFLYQGMWDGGHNVMAAHQPETRWYFAEGCTRQGFNQWLCIQNPNDKPAAARIDYMTEDGGLISKEYRIAAHSRCTVNVNNDVARQHDVSARIVSDLPVVAERPMYFLYNMTLDEGSDAMGTNKPCSSWYLAEGCTRKGFEEYVCLQNPGERKATVLLRFMLEDCSVREHTVTVKPGFRVTLKVNDVVGEGHDVSTEVMSDEPVVCERPMYAVYGGGIQAADTLSGYTFDK